MINTPRDQNQYIGECSRFLDFPLKILNLSRRYANVYKHSGKRLSMIHMCFVLAEEEDEIIELDGVKRYDINPPFMRVTYPGVYACHLRSSSRNELFFAYDESYLEAFKSFGFHDCNFKMTPRFTNLLNEVEELLPYATNLGVADRLDRLAVMLGLEAMLSALEPEEQGKYDNNKRIFQVEKFFQFHFTENFDLKNILPKYGMSTRTFYREWKEVFDISPAEYILNLRMQEAKRLLINSSLKIYEIAYSCGYPNELYFSRVFLKVNGLTPLAFRKQHLSSKNNNNLNNF